MSASKTHPPDTTAVPVDPQGAPPRAGDRAAAVTDDRETSSSAAAVGVSDDCDSPWKEGLEWFFPQAIALLAPRLYAKIDWSVPIQFLDKELQAIAFPSKKGRRYVDKLVQVRLRAGADAWLLIHIEVEGRLPGRKALRIFAWRMYEYRHRIQTRAMQQQDLELPPPIYSLGVLLENQGVGDHLVYSDEHLGQGVRFTFPVVELEAWRDRLDELESLARTNPFAVLIMAQLRANEHPDKRTRLGPKLDLVRGLRHYGYAPDVARQIYRLIDWVIALPVDLDSAYAQAMTVLRKESKMAFVPTLERVARRESEANLLLRMLQHRFGTVDDTVTKRLRTADSAHLETWALNFVDADTLDDVFRD